MWNFLRFLTLKPTSDKHDSYYHKMVWAHSTKLQKENGRRSGVDCKYDLAEGVPVW